MISSKFQNHKPIHLLSTFFYFQEQNSERCIFTKNASALTTTANQISLAFITFDLKKKWYLEQIYYLYYYYYT